MQSDPIGYGDGMNVYNYVGSDPVNGRDPTGAYEICTTYRFRTLVSQSSKVLDDGIETAGYYDTTTQDICRNEASPWHPDGFGDGSGFTGNTAPVRRGGKCTGVTCGFFSTPPDRTRTKAEKCKRMAKFGRQLKVAQTSGFAGPVPKAGPWALIVAAVATFFQGLNALNELGEGC